MIHTVTFHDLITNVSILSSAVFDQFEFIYSPHGGSINRETDVVYPEIRGIKVFVDLDNIPEGRVILEPLDTALYIAEEIFTAIVAKTQCYCYLARPYTCSYNGKEYTLEQFWREKIPRESEFRGGTVYLDDAPYLNENRNFHPMFHFYRAAKDETNTFDYRALNAWRFLEARHGLQGGPLKRCLIDNEGQPEDVINNFYAGVRCAVAHAERLKADPTTTEVILPSTYETQTNGTLYLDLSQILKYLDSIVMGMDPQPTDENR